MQYNFSLFFGLAVQMYEATLVSDDTPWDKFRRSHSGATDTSLNPWLNTNPEFISRQALFGAIFQRPDPWAFKYPLLELS